MNLFCNVRRVVESCRQLRNGIPQTQSHPHPQHNPIYTQNTQEFSLQNTAVSSHTQFKPLSHPGTVQYRLALQYCTVPARIQYCTVLYRISRTVLYATFFYFWVVRKQEREFRRTPARVRRKYNFYVASHRTNFPRRAPTRDGVAQLAGNLPREKRLSNTAQAETLAALPSGQRRVCRPRLQCLAQASPRQLWRSERCPLTKSWDSLSNAQVQTGHGRPVLKVSPKFQRPKRAHSVNAR